MAGATAKSVMASLLDSPMMTGMHGLKVPATVGMVQKAKTAVFFFQFLQGAAGLEVFHGFSSLM